MNTYSIKQMADLAGISRRTLRFYDEKGLLPPSFVGKNGYRYYDDESLLRLQQILFYREIGFELLQIKEILDQPGFDIISALQTHRKTLKKRISRLQTLIQTIDSTTMHLIGEIEMNEKKIFDGFSPEKQKEYEKEAVDQWGEKAAQSISLWNSYSDKQKEEIMQEGSEIYLKIVSNMDKGSDSKAVQALLGQWHEHLRNFYEPSIEVIEGLGKMYYDHPDFNANFSKIHPDLPAFLRDSIAIYADELVTRWLESELEILEDQE